MGCEPRSSILGSSELSDFPKILASVQTFADIKSSMIATNTNPTVMSTRVSLLVHAFTWQMRKILSYIARRSFVRFLYRICAGRPPFGVILRLGNLGSNGTRWQLFPYRMLVSMLGHFLITQVSTKEGSICSFSYMY